MMHLHSSNGQSGSGLILCNGLTTLPQGVVPAKTTNDSAKEGDWSGILLQPIIVNKQVNIKTFIENNCYSNLVKNTSGSENLHISLYSLDEMYTGMACTYVQHNEQIN